MHSDYDTWKTTDDSGREAPEDDGWPARDEWVSNCSYPGCCMPGEHYRSECHNAEDMEQYYAEQSAPTVTEPRRTSSNSSSSRRSRRCKSGCTS